MIMKRLLMVLDFDGLLVNSYELLRATFAEFDLDVGDEERFRNRRKFLKYFGGGRELLSNLAKVALPKKRRLREALTRNYLERGRVHGVFVPYVNACIDEPAVHVGVVSRNYTLRPGPTIRHVLAASGINERGLDFVIPLSVGSKKDDVLSAMTSPRFPVSLLAGDEVGDYRAAVAAGYTPVIASYGFDHRERLRQHGEVPDDLLFDTPAALVARLWQLSALYMETGLPPTTAPIDSLPGFVPQLTGSAHQGLADAPTRGG
ncbi:MAG: hypothetical protein WD928_18535 [Gammaproteobacteria bacterium]